MPPRRKGNGPPATFDVKAMRARMGLSQTDLVEKIFGERDRGRRRTIRAWEKGEQKPSVMARKHLQRVQQEFDAQQKTEPQTPDGAGAARVKGTRTPADTHDSPTSRPATHLTPGITPTGAS